MIVDEKDLNEARQHMKTLRVEHPEEVTAAQKIAEAVWGILERHPNPELVVSLMSLRVMEIAAERGDA